MNKRKQTTAFKIVKYFLLNIDCAIDLNVCNIIESIKRLLTRFVIQLAAPYINRIIGLMRNRIYRKNVTE